MSNASILFIVGVVSVHISAHIRIQTIYSTWLNALWALDRDAQHSFHSYESTYCFLDLTFYLWSWIQLSYPILFKCFIENDSKVIFNKATQPWRTLLLICILLDRLLCCQFKFCVLISSRTILYLYHPVRHCLEFVVACCN